MGKSFTLLDQAVKIDCLVIEKIVLFTVGCEGLLGFMFAVKANDSEA